MMLCQCDGCGKTVPCPDGFKPPPWFERTPPGERRPIHACSRECIAKVEEKRKAEGKQSSEVVLPL